jgi:hypothetical protein
VHWHIVQANALDDADGLRKRDHSATAPAIIGAKRQLNAANWLNYKAKTAAVDSASIAPTARATIQSSAPKLIGSFIDKHLENISSMLCVS